MLNAKLPTLKHYSNIHTHIVIQKTDITFFGICRYIKQPGFRILYLFYPKPQTFVS